MILRKQHSVLIQGITGRQGRFWSAKMQEYGTRIVGGVNPKQAGETCCDVPVFASAREAADELGGIDMSVMFIPPVSARDAAIDAIEAGVRQLVVLTEHIPSQDVMRIHAAARHHGTRIVGPNTAGIVTPGEAFAGIMPAFNRRVFMPGDIGVISRSGSLGTLICLNLVNAGFGQSAFLGIGGDPMLGTTTVEALRALQADERTRAIVIVGEIGGAMEEEAADALREVGKPVVPFIAGRASPPGKKMGHAGAIVMGNQGSYRSKRERLEAGGAQVVDTPGQIADALRQALASA
ncbi:CoA-binding protein [Pseudomonas sp. PS02288]|uniref:succinate--CoA ligase subunit alpha n=1 Tax=Pseudomonas sp. PS02288 TaxID=2991443 RepID=UPI00249C6F33|nr:CoA-binding protein [Pseudomonas sp. PS02288]